GIARDAAGRGVSVALVEQGDFGGATSSASTKLIHGGLRYLEQYEFRLVAEALAEREVLLRIASHIAWPMRFVMPHAEGLRPSWMIRAGLFLYDHIGGRISLPRSESVRLARDGAGAGLAPRYRSGYAYSDAWVDDARLVVLNLRSAHAHGAQLLPRTRFVSAQAREGRWRATIEHASGARETIEARTLVNAAGPWVDVVASAAGGRSQRASVQLVKGSHIVVPRIHPQPHAYILQNDDRRVIFLIPYERDFTLIGTTDVRVDSIEASRTIDDDETRYLLRAANRYLARPLAERDVVWSYTGVRPLYDDGSNDPSEITRDYTLELRTFDGAAQLDIYGGKITTYRRLAEAALDRLAPHLSYRRGSWTHAEALPGAPSDRVAARAELHARYPQLPRVLLDALFRRHGTLTAQLLGDATTLEALGEDFGGGLYERELRWFVENEWACSADDVLWRRSKAGLHMSARLRERVGQLFAESEKIA
ncbi:MAG TPA: glycerol-3-phosphate dehydrogenase, partial [Zeimonas sp.]